MLSLTRFLCRGALLGSTVLTLSCLTVNARAQQNSAQNNTQTQSASPSQTAAQDRQNQGLTNDEVAKMGQFLDDHKDINKQLSANPSLVNDSKYLDHHKDLQTFLNDHPRIRERCAQNPSFFTHREDWVNAREDARADARDRDATRDELADFRRFTDTHPEIAEQLRKDPSLGSNKDFVDHHPALQQYLQQHPGVRQQFADNPDAFMREERSFEQQADAANRDFTRDDLADFHRFADSHPEIAEQLRRDPSLVRNREFVDQHPALLQYLQDHPGVRQEFAENPDGFMRQEQSFDRRVDADDYDATRDRVADFHRFADSHPEIAEQLRKDPSLVKDRDFLDQHPDLHQYLQDHPGVQQGVTDHPEIFLQSPRQPDNGDPATKAPTPDQKPKP